MAVEMNARTFSRNSPILEIFSFHDLKWTYDVYGIHETSAMWLFKHYLTELMKTAFKSLAALPKCVRPSHKRVMHSSFEVAKFFINRYDTEDVIGTLENNLQALNQRVWTLTVFAQRIPPKTLTDGVVYNEENLKALFVESSYPSVGNALQ